MAEEGTQETGGAEGPSATLEDLQSQVARLEGAIGKERKAARDAQKARQAFDGIDPDAAREALAHADEAAEAKAKAEGQWDELRQKLDKKYQGEIQKVRDELEKARGALQRTVVSDSLTSAITEQGFHSDYVKAAKLELLHEHKPKMVERDGQFFGVFVDDVGDEIPIADYVKTWAQTDAAARYMRGSGASGGDASGSAPTGGKGGPMVIDANDQVAIGRNLEAIAAGTAVVR